MSQVKKQKKKTLQALKSETRASNGNKERPQKDQSLVLDRMREDEERREREGGTEGTEGEAARRAISENWPGSHRDRAHTHTHTHHEPSVSGLVRRALSPHGSARGSGPHTSSVLARGASCPLSERAQTPPITWMSGRRAAGPPPIGPCPAPRGLACRHSDPTRPPTQKDRCGDS